jgi:hypothetical protein
MRAPETSVGGRDLLLGTLAIRLDLKGLRIHRPVEDDGSAVEKAETAKARIEPAHHLRLVRELGSLAGSQVEEKDLRRFVPVRIGTEVDEGDSPAVGADHERIPGGAI